MASRSASWGDPYRGAGLDHSCSCGGSGGPLPAPIAVPLAATNHPAGAITCLRGSAASSLADLDETDDCPTARRRTTSALVRRFSRNEESTVPLADAPPLFRLRGSRGGGSDLPALLARADARKIAEPVEYFWFFRARECDRRPRGGRVARDTTRVPPSRTRSGEEKRGLLAPIQCPCTTPGLRARHAV